MNGYQVMPLLDACQKADIVLTVTGVRDTIDSRHFEAMKDGVLIANAGHFRNEINVDALDTLALEQSQMRDKVRGYKTPSGKWLYLVSARYLVDFHEQLEADVYHVPEEIDQQVAQMKLAGMQINIDTV